MTWHQLSDAELYARLVQRGISEETATRITKDRDQRDTAALLADLLEGDPCP